MDRHSKTRSHPIKSLALKLINMLHRQDGKACESSGLDAKFNLVVSPPAEELAKEGIAKGELPKDEMAKVESQVKGSDNGQRLSLAHLPLHNTLIDLKEEIDKEEITNDEMANVELQVTCSGNSGNGTQPSLANLPHFVLQSILIDLDLRTVTRASQSCKSVYVVVESVRFWKERAAKLNKLFGINWYPPTNLPTNTAAYQTQLLKSYRNYVCSSSALMFPGDNVNLKVPRAIISHPYNSLPIRHGIPDNSVNKIIDIIPFNSPKLVCTPAILGRSCYAIVHTNESCRGPDSPLLFVNLSSRQQYLTRSLWPLGTKWFPIDGTNLIMGRKSVESPVLCFWNNDWRNLEKSDTGTRHLNSILDNYFGELSTDCVHLAVYGKSIIVYSNPHLTDTMAVARLYVTEDNTSLKLLNFVIIDIEPFRTNRVDSWFASGVSDTVIALTHDHIEKSEYNRNGVVVFSLSDGRVLFNLTKSYNLLWDSQNIEISLTRSRLLWTGFKRDEHIVTVCPLMDEPTVVSAKSHSTPVKTNNSPPPYKKYSHKSPWGWTGSSRPAARVAKHNERYMVQTGNGDSIILVDVFNKNARFFNCIQYSTLTADRKVYVCVLLESDEGGVDTYYLAVELDEFEARRVQGI